MNKYNAQCIASGLVDVMYDEYGCQPYNACMSTHSSRICNALHVTLFSKLCCHYVGMPNPSRCIAQCNSNPNCNVVAIAMFANVIYNVTTLQHNCTAISTKSVIQCQPKLQCNCNCGYVHMRFTM